MSELEDRYRAWLRCYPRDYRRRHGPELITTLMDRARPGQTEPDPADVFDLVRGGLRQRFRLPAGRWTLAVAVVAALFCGGIGAAAGAWAAWRVTPVAMPGDAEVLRLAGIALDRAYPAGTTLEHTEHHGIPAVFPWAAGDPGVMRWEAGYAPAAAARVAAEGWEPGPIETGLHQAGGEYDLHRTAFVAERGGVLMEYVAQWPATRNAAGDRPAWVTTSFRAEMPWTAYAGGVAGALAAAAGIWLFIAWAGYRLRRADPWWRTAGLLCGVTALMVLALPATAVWIDGAAMLRPDPLLSGEPAALWGALGAFDRFYLAASMPFLLVAALIAGTARERRPMLVAPPA